MILRLSSTRRALVTIALVLVSSAFPLLADAKGSKAATPEKGAKETPAVSLRESGRAHV